MLSSKSLGCLERGRVIFGRLCGEIPAAPPLLPPPALFLELGISDVLAGSSLLVVEAVEEEMVDSVEEEFVDADLERKDRSCLSFLSLNKVSMEMRVKSGSSGGD